MALTRCFDLLAYVFFIAGFINRRKTTGPAQSIDPFAESFRLTKCPILNCKFTTPSEKRARVTHYHCPFCCYSKHRLTRVLKHVKRCYTKKKLRQERDKRETRRNDKSGTPTSSCTCEVCSGVGAGDSCSRGLRPCRERKEGCRSEGKQRLHYHCTKCQEYTALDKRRVEKHYAKCYKSSEVPEPSPEPSPGIGHGHFTRGTQM